MEHNSFNAGIGNASILCYNAWIDYYKCHKKDLKKEFKKKCPVVYKELKCVTLDMIYFGARPQFKKYLVTGSCTMVPLYFNIKNSQTPSYVLYNQDFSEEMWLTDEEKNVKFCLDHIDCVDKNVLYEFQAWTYDKKERCFSVNGTDTAQYAAGRSVERREFKKNNIKYGLGRKAETMMNWLKPRDVTINESPIKSIIEIPIKKVYLDLPSKHRIFIGTYFNNSNSVKIEKVQLI